MSLVTEKLLSLTSMVYDNPQESFLMLTRLTTMLNVLI